MISQISFNLYILSFILTSISFHLILMRKKTKKSTNAIFLNPNIKWSITINTFQSLRKIIIEKPTYYTV